MRFRQKRRFVPLGCRRFPAVLHQESRPFRRGKAGLHSIVGLDGPWDKYYNILNNESDRNIRILTVRCAAAIGLRDKGVGL